MRTLRRAELGLWTRAAALAMAVALQGAAIAASGEPVNAPAKGEPAKGAPSTKAETAKADENRKKPLQRCDELKDKAQLDCLQKARERIVEARSKREAKGEKK
jgi:hypothetical protein